MVKKGFLVNMEKTFEFFKKKLLKNLKTPPGGQRGSPKNVGGYYLLFL
jgi:hypothetical protein